MHVVILLLDAIRFFFRIIKTMNTHQYSFMAKLSSGRLEGLWLENNLCSIVMNAWDSGWLELMEQSGLRIKTGVRYMDDIRIFANAIKEGEDGGSTARTARVMVDIMTSIWEFFNFTVEVEDDP